VAGQVLINSSRGPTALSESAGLWVVSSVGGEPERLLDVPAGTTSVIAVTPDGSTVAALHRSEDNGWGILAGSVSSRALQRYEPAPFTSPRLSNRPALEFSPDGRQLLLMWNPVDGEQAWLMPYPPDPAQPPRRILRKLPAFEGTPTFSWMSDNRHIVVSTSEPRRPLSLYVADTVSEEFRLLAGGTGTAHLLAPAVAPDGTKLVVTEIYNDLDIVTLDLGTAAVTPLIDTNRAEQMPAWASSNSALDYVTDRNGGP
jgi:Tol biopolymer transport system component